MFQVLVPQIKIESRYLIKILRCNPLNLITTTRLRKKILNMDGKSHVLHHVAQKIMELWKDAQSKELC